MHFLPTFGVELIRWMKAHWLRIIELHGTLSSAMFCVSSFFLCVFASSKYPFISARYWKKVTSSMNVICETILETFWLSQFFFL